MQSSLSSLFKVTISPVFLDVLYSQLNTDFALKYSKIKRAMPATQRDCQLCWWFQPDLEGNADSCRPLLFRVVAKLGIANKHWCRVHIGHY
jgi:hypothetical protein